MTKHPCEGMTKAEISAFEAIAINRPPNCSKRTIDKLLVSGVIANEKHNLHFRDGLPPSTVDNYFVPLPIERYRGRNKK